MLVNVLDGYKNWYKMTYRKYIVGCNTSPSVRNYIQIEPISSGKSSVIYGIDLEPRISNSYMWRIVKSYNHFQIKDIFLVTTSLLSSSNTAVSRQTRSTHDCSTASPYGVWFNIEMTPHLSRKSHCGDKTILRPSYLLNRISYSKTTALYWIRGLV